MKPLIAVIGLSAALTVGGCAIEQTHLLGSEWKKSVLDTNGTEGGARSGSAAAGGKK